MPHLEGETLAERLARKAGSKKTRPYGSKTCGSGGPLGPPMARRLEQRRRVAQPSASSAGLLVCRPARVLRDDLYRSAATVVSRLTLHKFKQETGYAWKKRTNERLWQSGFL